MAEIHGGESLVRMLEKEGIRHIFGLHGGHIDVIFQACADHGIAVYDTRHEAAAGHMAEGWARATGRPVCINVMVDPQPPSPMTVVSAAAFQI